MNMRSEEKQDEEELQKESRNWNIRCRNGRYRVWHDSEAKLNLLKGK